MAEPSSGPRLVGVPKETVQGERRVALVPELVAKLQKVGLEVLVQPGAGVAAGFPDALYTEQGATLDADVFSKSDVLVKVQPPTPAEVGKLKDGAIYVGFLQPYTNDDGIRALLTRR